MNLSQPDQLPAELQAKISFRELEVGQILFAQHEPADAIYILKSGQIRLLNYTEDGQQINHYSVKVGDSFAEVALFNEVFVCTAIASMPSQVMVLPKPPFLAALKQCPALAETFMARLAQRLHENKLLLELRSIRSAQKRVLHYLQLNVQPDGITIHFNYPLKEIADDLGLTPETLSRTLKQLHQEGRISRTKRKITLRKDFATLDPDHSSPRRRVLNFKTTNFL